jgi:hypothetical protein
MRSPTLYLDTSILGGYFDDEWKQPTQELWRQMESGLWRFVTSLVVAEELLEAQTGGAASAAGESDGGGLRLVAYASESAPSLPLGNVGRFAPWLCWVGCEQVG